MLKQAGNGVSAQSNLEPQGHLISQAPGWGSSKTEMGLDSMRARAFLYCAQGNRRMIILVIVQVRDIYDFLGFFSFPPPLPLNLLWSPHTLPSDVDEVFLFVKELPTDCWKLDF